jgi:type VI secretion system protein
MYDRSLLERLQEATDGAASARETGSIARLQFSVLTNLRRILNARQGCCETRTDFGMADLNDAIGQGADAVLSVARLVQAQIEAFEPRLENVTVRFLREPDNPLQLAFHITATLHYGEQSEPIAFDTILSDDKRITVRG